MNKQQGLDFSRTVAGQDGDMAKKTAVARAERDEGMKTSPNGLQENGLPSAQGLYDPRNEHDACGVGFVANMHNEKSHDLVRMGLQILLNLDHRGAVGADPKAGDGCGMLMQIPHRFFADEAKRLGFALPEPGLYAVGSLFFPRDPEGRKIVQEIFERAIAAQGQKLLGWRDVPVNPSVLGESVIPTEPCCKQVFIARGDATPDQQTFERKLFLIRKIVSNDLRALGNPKTKGWYPVSLSSRTIVYKGLLVATALGEYFLDLQDERVVTAIALVHQRFSTNTFPSWQLAHPYRMVAHNGEINTLRGNVNWMAARQPLRRLAAVRRRNFKTLADVPAWPVRYRQSRQCAGTAAGGGLSARPCGDDADSGSVVRQHADG